MSEKGQTVYLLKAVHAFKRRITVVSPDFEILAVSRILGDTDGTEWIGRRCYQVYHDKESPCDNCAVREVMETGEPSLRPKPEDIIDLSRMPCYYAYPIFDGERIEAFVSMDFDLPALGALDEKLKQSGALLRNLIHSAVDCVIAADKRGKILIFNEAASEVFGYSSKEALTGLNIRDIYPDKLAYDVMKMLRSEDCGGRGKLRAYQVDVMAKSGERIPILLNASIVYEKGIETATIGVFHDLREELRMKDKMERIQMQLMQAEKMSSLGQLAAGVAHQLNNPLGGITLYAKLIMEEYDLDKGAQEDLHRILRDAERSRDIVKELLEFTRQTRHLMQVHDINKAITRTLFLLGSQTLFQNIEIETALSASVPPILADIQQLNHMFMNLFLNAAQAMKGQGRLTVNTYPLSGGDKICIEVSDTGPGIPEDVLPRIFEPFFTTKEQGKGTGLGLSMVYNIVENHGGGIEVKKAHGSGAAFVIELPIQNKEDRDGRDTG